MDPARKPILADFAEIKRHLDPSFSYAVFERDAEGGEDQACSESTGLFSRLEKRVVNSELYLAQRARRPMLIVTIDPKDAETIMEDLFDTGLPRGVLYYVWRGVSEKR